MEEAVIFFFAVCDDVMNLTATAQSGRRDVRSTRASSGRHPGDLGPSNGLEAG